jgi:Cu(I)/Ag(I) efflux system periplasmic protein CusF
MKRTPRSVLALIAAMAAWSAPAIAQPSKTDDHAKHHAAAAPGVAGEIRKVDREAKKLTIKHDEIRHLDMPPMTMVFQVKDSALLDRVKVGDKVQFTVEKASSGAFVVTDVQPAK